MANGYKETARVFKALGDENRLQILALLRGGEKCACKLLDELQITQPTLSHHMKILCDAGIVAGRKEGKWMHYSIDSEGAVYTQVLLKQQLTFDETGDGAGCKSCHVQYENAKTAIQENCKLRINCEGKPKVAFICVHNSCRSQIAEALGKKLASDVFESYSAGTALKDHINPDAVRLMKQVHGIDMEETQYNKLVEDIPAPDIAIFMGCNVICPNIAHQHAEDWGLDDPSGKSDEVFLETIRRIEEKVIQLREKLR